MRVLRRRGPRLLLLLLTAITVSLWPTNSSAHYERPTHAPDGSGSVPAYRTTGSHLVVCKNDDADFAKRIQAFPSTLQDVNRQLYAECLSRGYRDLQAAVDHVGSPGMTILVLPGVYMEEPSLLRGADYCYHLPAESKSGYQILSYEQQKSCPHQQNLVGIFGVKDLQIEGTGAAPSDVIFDAQFQKLNVIRGDRTSGLYLRNFTAQRSTFNAVYVLEADGFVIDRVIGRWNHEYGFLSFAADHGLFTRCEAYGNGDSGIYPGGTSDINRGRGLDVPRYAIEVTGCHSHDNTLGYSGTGGDSVWVHDNEFDHNMGGASMDSLFPNHPGLPQNHALFEHNLIHSNNSNYYKYVRDGTCALPYLQRLIEQGTVCPAVPVPVGTGILVIGGNYDVFRDNWVYDNWKVGFVQTWVPGLVRGDYLLPAQEETSHFNRYLANHMGTSAAGQRLPNGLDFFWDGQGTGNCWQTANGDVVEPIAIPACPNGSQARIIADPNKLVLYVVCSNYDLASKTLPAGCDWFDTPARPGNLAATLSIQSVFPAIQLVAVLFLFALLRAIGRPRPLAFAAAATAGLGSVLLLVASVEQFYYLNAPAIAILGIGWLGAVPLMPSRRLAVLTLVLGVAALLEAVDFGVVQLPSPVGPVWVRLVLELAWIVWTARILIKPARTTPRPVAVA
ncbi:MAG TPA: right-handed parallel beta-helix repeat-containing protein [Candidatus Dormibacteraeota bacterium]|nr:right-handed parallel beta-helix repeat-containing protein [Candidatus Dormibacteraeota bacterium]